MAMIHIRGMSGAQKAAASVVLFFTLASTSSASGDSPRPSKGKKRGAGGTNSLTLTHTKLPPLTWKDLANQSPLSPEEEASPAVAALAKRFAPAMAFPTRDIWPVEVRYAWHDGSPLWARVVSPNGHVQRDYVALPHDRLAKNDWGDLPTHDENGHRIDYYVDAPGDDRIVGQRSGWRQRWQDIMGGNPAAHEIPRATEYPPTQYVHLFWFNREKGLLAIQYWFYYPYNEWINHHEGDWERINVIVRGPSRLTEKANFRPVGYQFFFHLWTYEPTQVVRVRGAHPKNDHVVVYAGGHSQFLLWQGSTSGGSYPLPALFPAAGGGFGRWRPADDTTKPARFLRPEDFNLVILPEPDRVDVGANPELAWLRLSFFAGQLKMQGNPLSLNGLAFGMAPQQPARQGGWNAEWNSPYWTEKPIFDSRALRLPREWQAVVQSPPRAFEAVAARRAPKRVLSAVVP